MSTYEVSVSASFDAAHALPLGSGRMEDSHTHRWETTATFRSDNINNEMGIVVDFVAVSEALEAIAGRLGGKNLNDLEAFAGKTTSAEHVAERIASELQRYPDLWVGLYRISVTEAPGCQAAYYPSGA